MSSNGHNRLMGKQSAAICGVLLEARADGKLYVVPSDNVNTKTPEGLETTIKILTAGLNIVAEIMLMRLEGEGRDVLKDAIVAHSNSIGALAGKYLPTLEGKLIDAVPAGAIPLRTVGN